MRHPSAESARRTRPRRAAWHLTGLLLAAGATQAQPTPRLIEVWLNGQRVDTYAPLMEDAGTWYAPAAALTQWRLQPSDVVRWIDGVPHHSLQTWRPVLDTVTQRLWINAAVDDFLPQRLRLNAATGGAVGDTSSRAPVIEPLPGMALDYMANLERDAGATRHAALVDLRAFGWNAGGLLRTSGVVRGGEGQAPQSRWQRLDSAWSQADPDGLRRTTVGDAITCGGELAPALRFAGVQHGTDFTLRPDLVTQPLPAVQGNAQVPTGVDLLVNGSPAGSASVGPGRYTLDTLPGLTGAGEIRVVQRDVLGVEQVQTVPYYATPRLLRPGLLDGCAEAGVLRRGYATPSDDYRGGFVAGALRHGLAADVTVLGRVEIGQGVRALHGALHWVPAQAGVFSALIATSRADGPGTGRRARLGFERIGPQGTITLGLERSDTSFRLLDGSTLPHQRASAFAGTSLKQTTVTAGVVRQIEQDGRRTEVLSAGLQRRLGEQWNGAVNVYRREGRTSASLLFTRALDTRTTVAWRAQAGAESGVSGQVQRNEPGEGGLGWRLQGGSDTLQGLAGVSWLGDAGRVELQAARWRGDPSMHWRATAQGGVMWFGGAPLLGRSLGESAAARVELDGLPGVGVQLNHRDTAVTDADGHAWVWGLLPWQDNTLGISADVLPMDVAVGVPTINVRAPAQTAVRVRFPAARTRSVLLVVKRPDGSWVAPGSRALRRQDGADSGAPFAHGGQVWLGDVGDTATELALRIEGPQGLCHLRVDLPEDVLMATLGPVSCTLEAR